jgi:hypothetical protein
MPSFKDIKNYLVTGKHPLSRWLGYTGLCLGIILLLSSVQLYLNIDDFIEGKQVKQTVFDYAAVTKMITNQNMGQDNRFSDSEIDDIKQQTFIDDAAPLIGNLFRAQITGGELLPFSTDLFLEGIRNEFLDTIPSTFVWQEGNNVVPIILSADYLELYNIFAPAQGLPQISEQSLGAFQLRLVCSGYQGDAFFYAKVVGLSYRINTILVPENFLIWANKNIAGQTDNKPSRIYIKTSDIDNPALTTYLSDHGFYINKEKFKSGRLKVLLKSFTASLGIFALLVIVLSFILFSFYLQLIISRSKENLQLLITLGYAPQWLSSMVAKKWVPVYLIIVTVAIIITAIFQYFFSQTFQYKDTISPWLKWETIAIAILLTLVLILANKKLIRKALYQI